LHLSNSATQGGEVIYIENLIQYEENIMQLTNRRFKDLAVNYQMESNLNKHKTVLESMIKSIQLLDMDNLETYDIFHCHTWYTALAGIILKTMFPQKKLVFSIHSMEVLRPWKKDSIGRDGYKLSNFLEGSIITLADQIIVSSSGTIASLSNYFPHLPLEKIKIIYPGIAEVFRQRLPLLPEFGFIRDFSPLFLFVGRGTKQKGIEYLIHSAAYIQSDAKILLLIGRYDNAAYQAEIEGLIARFADRIIYRQLDWVSQETIASIMQHCHAFCSSSLYETFGLTTAEANASGLPVIGTAIEGTMDIIEQGVNGVLIDIENKDVQQVAQEFARHIDWLATDKAHYAALQQHALSKSQTYSWKKNSQNIVAVYHALLGLAGDAAPC
jgi:glycosyltransferase involved in cell wall biosynthesis